MFVCTVYIVFEMFTEISIHDTTRKTYAERIERCKNMKERLVALRKQTGLNRREFSEYFGIPYRTMQDWELGNRQMPEYLLRLMMYKIEVEKLRKGE